jgi:hypothetical protein
MGDRQVGVILEIILINMLVVVAYIFGEVAAIQMHDWANSCHTAKVNMTAILNQTFKYGG